MDITVKELRDVLGLLDPAVPRKTALPVLQNVLLEGTRAVASDMEVVVAVELEREVGDPFCVPHPTLYDLLQYTPGDTTVTLEGGAVLGIKMRGGTASLVAGLAQDYPPVPTLAEPRVAVLDGSALVKATREVLPYASKEDSRPVLTALCLALGEPGEVAAADGFRLTIQPLPDSHPHLEGQRILLPAHSVKVLGHLWRHAAVPPSDEEGDLAQVVIGKRLMRLEYDDQLARFTFGRVTLTVKRVQGTFPNYRPLVPEAPDAVCSFLGEDMSRAVDMLEPMAAQGSGIMRMEWEGEVMTLRAAATEVGDVSTQVRLLSSTRPGRIAISAKYLGPLLRARGGIVTMETTTPSAPAVFKASGHPLVVLMPMSVQWDGAQPTTEVQQPPAEQPAQEQVSEPAPEASTPPVTAKKPRTRRTRNAA